MRLGANILELPSEKLVAVIDVETTGLFPFRHDRVIEVAAVVIREDGSVEREFESLINPKRDIGPSRIHGLKSDDVLNAPVFAEIAGHLLHTLQGTVAIAAHNVRFDQQFLETEFNRIGYKLPEYYQVCTMQLAGGGSLEDCCNLFGVSPEGKRHSAIVDARAAARLLVTLLQDQPKTLHKLRELSPIQWPSVAERQRPPLSRAESLSHLAAKPTYIQKLLQRRRDHALPEASDGASIAYGALLDRALEDRQVDDGEAEVLVETAIRWGLTNAQIENVHRSYVNQLVIAAIADGNVSENELKDLKVVARLLGQTHNDMDKTIEEAGEKLSESYASRNPALPARSNLRGLRVCFTGELQGQYADQHISRELAEDLATRGGLIVVDTVTKSCDLLVLADPSSQSGKARKARAYGIRVMHEAVFWKSIDVDA